MFPDTCFKWLHKNLGTHISFGLKPHTTHHQIEKCKKKFKQIFRIFVFKVSRHKSKFGFIVRTYAYIQFYHYQQYAASMLWTFFTLRKTDLAVRACWIDMNMHIILNTISLLGKGHLGIYAFIWMVVIISMLHHYYL